MLHQIISQGGFRQQNPTASVPRKKVTRQDSDGGEEPSRLQRPAERNLLFKNASLSAEEEEVQIIKALKKHEVLGFLNLDDSVHFAIAEVGLSFIEIVF